MTDATAKKKPLKTDEDRLEAALEDSFPASDPPSMTAPTQHVGKPEKKKGEAGKDEKTSQGEKSDSKE